MWIVIESTANYSLRGRTVAVKQGATVLVVGCMLVGLGSAGALLFAQFVPGFSAEQIQQGWTP